MKKTVVIERIMLSKVTIIDWKECMKKTELKGTAFELTIIVKKLP